MNLTKPHRLHAGDKVAVVSPSWGGPAAFPHRQDAGLRQLRDTFGVEIVAMPHARKPESWLTQNPRARADDLMAAFADPSIKAIITSIGGDDSIRLLPFIDFDVIRANPKIFMGYSDTTALHFMCRHARLSSFYGPAIMAGFGENGGMHDYTRDSVLKTLFQAEVIGRIDPAPAWTVDHLDWGDPKNQDVKRKMTPGDGYRVLNGHGIAAGHLIGGCMEVLEMVKGTAIWPELDQWRGAILFLETSEEKPSVDYFKRWLRNYGSQGILQVAAGVIFGRPQEEAAQQNIYDEMIVRIIRDELGLVDLPVLAGLNFGHTDPMFVIPYGARAEINADQKTFSILEPVVL